MDRFGARRIVIAGILLMALGLILYSQVRTTWQFYAVYLIVSTGAGLGGWIAIATIINNWFVRRRTFALSLTMVGSQFIGFFIPLSLLLLLSDIYFRVAFPIIGIFLMCSAIPVARFMHNRPYDLKLRTEEESSRQVDSGPIEPEGKSAGQTFDVSPWDALRTGPFWILVATRLTVGTSSALISMSISMAASQVSLGYSIQFGLQSAVVHSIVGPAISLLAGFAADRLSIRPILYITLAAQALAACIMAFAGTGLSAFTIAILAGASSSAFGPLATSITGELFGRKRFASILGLSILLSGIFGQVVFILLSWASATYGGSLIFVPLAVTELAVAFVILRVRPPRSPAEPT